ncbi:disulfide bond formation protein B [Shimia sagamensis]|uniref:Disulfide bond formation protein DsbB n=1 Tax=Shimia sagamensis TaxID=1566352 RepID=A0ABY1PIE7_9RHOB|nr:disulfide bond formation protein B [Shimia sagamensis]SMP35099.1 Disulfide bond formation protein DsbB [Shimia sagamensis]
MTLTQRLAFILLTGFSVSMILGAWGFEFIGEMPPCKLCYYQRYPHWVASGAGILAILTGTALFAYLAAAGAAGSGIVGLYHTGVERKWWDGPSTCTSSDVSNMSADDLFNQIMQAPLVRCDEIPWELFGFSMANYNALLSLGAGVFWIYAIKKLT